MYNNSSPKWQWTLEIQYTQLAKSECMFPSTEFQSLELHFFPKSHFSWDVITQTSKGGRWFVIGIYISAREVKCSLVAMFAIIE